ncbi:hypothetical protein GCM10010124_30420 [Pilimelia terevasa]|uniref:MaoC-like domain-containing protein n=1 Tax=Pilimelia terevasa TaxID=53372 RepID=A0A8J3FLL9_9ACTN|nr:MaoC/PaaZ C-terminal domain-containing protein [Pilimelia terevasa]GGK35606.1 hypothetical protein GCM10010124_30420 [Pilimelia terevasa]
MRVELDRMPEVGPLYRRAVGRALPVPRALGQRGGRQAPRTLPAAALAVDGVTVDVAHLAAYARVCGFPLRDALPATYPHVLAFPLAMALMSRDDFPFPMVGLVHVANRIEVLRELAASATLTVTAVAEELRPHPRGRQFDLAVEVTDADGLAWRGVSTYLRRERAADAGGGDGDGPAAGAAGAGADPAAHGGGARHGDPGAGSAAGGGEVAPTVARWKLGTGVGRSYAAVSGDRNPIHTSALGARLFGFRRPIAHGMWSKARCLAALDGRLPATYAVDVAFRSPILLPGGVDFGAAEAAGGRWRFSLGGGERVHLTGHVGP